MSRSRLKQALEAVPMLATLGITLERARPGDVTLRLPARPRNLSHAGTLHTAALFAVGEAAAGVALGTHPRLVGIVHLLKASGIKYLATCSSDATARARADEMALDRVLLALESGAPAKAELVVPVLDGRDRKVAEVVTVWAFRR